MTKNDISGEQQGEEFPFENSKRDMKLHQDKLKCKMYEVMDKFFKAELGRFGVTEAQAFVKTKNMIRKEAE